MEANNTPLTQESNVPVNQDQDPKIQKIREKMDELRARVAEEKEKLTERKGKLAEIWQKGRSGKNVDSYDFKPDEDNPPEPGIGEPIDTYVYRDSDGSYLFEKLRYDTTDPKKKYKIRRPDGKGGWIWNINGVKRVLYNLPELLKSGDAPIYLCEGEKDAKNLASWGLVTTTNFDGATPLSQTTGKPAKRSKWLPHYNRWLCDRDVIILPDLDPSGRNFTQERVKSLTGYAKSIKVIELPIPEGKGKDVSDWIALGYTKEEFLQIVEENQGTLEQKPKGLFEILAEPEEEANFIVDPIFQEGDKSLLVATWKLGKTLLDTQLSLCASKPTPSFLGYPIPQARNVLYVRFELKERRFKVRLHSMIGGMGHHFERIPQFHLYRGFDLLNQECADWLYSNIDEYEVELLIMEPMYKMFSLPLSKPESASPILRAYEQIQIRFPKIHIHTAHHERRLPIGIKEKDLDDVREKVYGPMQIYADMDWQLFLSSDKVENDPTFTLNFLSNDVDLPSITLKRDPETLLYIPESGESTRELESMWNILNELMGELGKEPTQNQFQEVCKKKSISVRKFRKLLRQGIQRKMWDEQKGERNYLYYKLLPKEGWKQG
jgi:hypothetical protein